MWTNLSLLCILLPAVVILSMPQAAHGQEEAPEEVVGLAEVNYKAIEEERIALKEKVLTLQQIVMQDEKELDELTLAQEQIQEKWIDRAQEEQLSFEEMERQSIEETRPLKERFEVLNAHWWQASGFLAAAQERIETLDSFQRSADQSGQEIDVLLKNIQEFQAQVAAFINPQPDSQ